MSKLHLVDGTYELFRMFYGAPSARNAAGQEVGATRALLGSLWSLTRRHDVSHIAIAFDTEVTSFRNEMFDGYKTGEGIEPDILAQFELAERAARALGIHTWSMIEFEADDALAAAAHHWRNQFEQVVICSPDKDLAQCVLGDDVVMWDRRRGITLNENGVIEKFGIPPAAIPDYLALVGDSADGIPGIPRWGAKSTATVLTRYGTISDIPDDASDWDIKVRGAKTLAENLATRRDDANLFRSLATLRTDVPLGEVDAVAWYDVDRAQLESLCVDIEDDDVLRRVQRDQSRSEDATNTSVSDIPF